MKERKEESIGLLNEAYAKAVLAGAVENAEVRGLRVLDEACFDPGPTLWHTYRVSVGDRYDDGHGKHEFINVSTNYNSKEICEAYKKSSEVIGHCVFEDICTDYEDNTVKSEVVMKLLECGVNIDPFEKSLNDEDHTILWMDAEGLVKLVMEMAKVHLPYLKYKIVTDEVEEMFINSIGYGVFS